MTGDAVSTGRRRQLRRLLIGVAGLAVVFVSFALAFVGAQHEPRPHRVPVDLIGGGPRVAALGEAIARQTGEMLLLRRVPDETTARRDIEERTVYAGFEPHDARLLVAPAASPAVQQLVTGIFAATARSAGRPAGIVDVAPLPAGDPRGLSVFLLTLPLIIGGIGAAAVFNLFGTWLSTTAHVVGLVGCALLLAVLGALVADPLAGALTGHFCALVAIAWLIAGATALPTAAAVTAIGIGGAPLAALTFVMLGNSASGATTAPELLPGYFRVLGQQMPPGAGVQAVRNVHYFHSHALGAHLVVLAAWTTAGLLALVLAAGLRASGRKAGAARAADSEVEGQMHVDSGGPTVKPGMSRPAKAGR